MLSDIHKKLYVSGITLTGYLLITITLPISSISASQTNSFSAIDGIIAFQNRAPKNPTLTTVYSRWKNAIQFYVASGINRLPNSMISDLRSAGVTVEDNLSQKQIDDSFNSSNTNVEVIQQFENSTSSDSNTSTSGAESSVGEQSNSGQLSNDSASQIASDLASGTGSSTVNQTSNSSNPNSSDAISSDSINSSNSSPEVGAAGTAGASNIADSGSNVEESSLLGNNNRRTSYVISTQFGRIIQALGGNSSGNLGRSAARGFINYDGSKPPSLHSDGPVNSGGANIPSSGGSNGSIPGTSVGISEDPISDLGDQLSGGGGSGSDGGLSGSTTSGSSGGSSGDDSVTGGYAVSSNYTCSLGAYGGQCVKYVRDQFANHPGVSGLSPLCGASSNSEEDCGAKFAYLSDLWDLGYGKGVTPRKNSVAVWYSQNSDYGHMAVVYDVVENPNGTYNILIHDSNWTGNETQMCAIPYEVDTSTMQTLRNGNPNPKTLIGFIYGESADTDSSGDGSTTGGSFTAGSTDGGILAGGPAAGGSGGTGTTGLTGDSSNDQTDINNGNVTASPVTLGLSVSSIVFTEYGVSQNIITNSQVIGTDISESDFLQANQQTNPALVSLYNGIKNDADFKYIAELALAINPNQPMPRLILADDNQVNQGNGITPQYNPNTNEIILGNAAFSQNTLMEMKVIAIHELAHSQQKIRVFDMEQLYGPDGQHYATEITSLTGAYVEGYAEFWQAYYEPSEWAKFQFGMSHCGFRREGSNSTVQNPEYNGIVGASLSCEDMIPWTSLEKEDFFKIEGLIASILLEVALRIPDGFPKLIQALVLENNEGTTSIDILNMLGQILSDEDNARYLLILDVMTNFQYSLDELKQISGTTNLTIEGFTYDQPMALLGGLTGRDLIMQEARKTVDSNGFVVHYNGFHALDQLNTSIGSQALLPRIDARALSRGSNKASEPDVSGEIYFSGKKETAF
ncbi:MAG: CHAP domain-containing protein, partial [bacterium]|nr:CHAP domain-containing protein [bacterium]